MNWFVFGNGWVWLLGLITVGLAIRAVFKSEWVAAAAFGAAVILQVVFTSDIRRFFDGLARALVSALSM